MSENDSLNGYIELVDVDVRAWVELARANPTLHRNRQATEIILAAIGTAPKLADTLVLKGGTLMALAFKSDRVTGDVDFSARTGPENFAELLVSELNEKMPRVAIEMGYPDLVCRVQRVEKRPRPQNFENMKFPALAVRVGHAIRGTRQHDLLKEGRSANIVEVEISFRDQVYNFQELNLMQAQVAVKAFTIDEIIAEKFRALIQQPILTKNRRQDVFDISFLIENYADQIGSLDLILKTLEEKCASRNITPEKESLRDPEVRERAQADWKTLGIEVGKLPDFADCYDRIKAFYEGLPW